MPRIIWNNPLQSTRTTTPALGSIAKHYTDIDKCYQPKSLQLDFVRNGLFGAKSHQIGDHTEDSCKRLRDYLGKLLQFLELVESYFQYTQIYHWLSQNPLIANQ